MPLPNVDMPAAVALDTASLAAAVRGENPRVSRETALVAWVTRVGIPDRHLLLQTILEDRTEPANLRYLAARFLGKIDTPGSIAILKRNLQISDPGVVRGVIKSLGRIGDRESMDVIHGVRGRLRGPAAGEAAWALTLLAHRWQVGGHEIAMPREDDDLPLERPSQTLQIREGTQQEYDALMRSVTVEPLGMRVARTPMYHLACGPQVMMLLFNAAVVDDSDLSRAFQTCRLAGIIVHWHHHDEVFAPIYFALTCPAGRGNRIHVSLANANGRPCAAGIGTFDGDRMRLSVRGVSGFGNRPLEVAGVLARGTLEFTRAIIGRGVVRTRRAQLQGANPGHR